MPVLTRKQKQTITIGDDITITVLRVKGHSVKIGIDAPRGIRVLRSELTQFDADLSEAATDDDAQESTSHCVISDEMGSPSFTEPQKAQPADHRANRRRVASKLPSRTPSAVLSLSQWIHGAAEVV
jgi:carbon storage regulator